jgi:hypothetical protein
VKKKTSLKVDVDRKTQLQAGRTRRKTFIGCFANDNEVNNGRRVESTSVYPWLFFPFFFCCLLIGKTKQEKKVCAEERFPLDAILKPFQFWVLPCLSVISRLFSSNFIPKTKLFCQGKNSKAWKIKSYKKIYFLPWKFTFYGSREGKVTVWK